MLGNIVSGKVGIKEVITMKKDILNINVFNGDDGIKYIRYDDMISMLNRIKEDNEERDKEIERLNSIINELEKYLEEIKDRVIMYAIDDDTYKKTNLYIDIKNKIKELKGSDKE